MGKSIMQGVFTVCLWLTCIHSSHAQSVSCSGDVTHVEVEAGPLRMSRLNLLYPRVIEPAPLDYDEYDEPILTEWNVNLDGLTNYPVAHCFKTEGGFPEESFLIPDNIHQCHLDHGRFTCAAGTMACAGAGIVHVEIDAWKHGEKTNEQRKVLWGKSGEVISWDVPQMADLEVTYVAHCFPLRTKWTPRETDIIALPPGMKRCVLSRERFICTDNPDRHNAFWPSTP